MTSNQEHVDGEKKMENSQVQTKFFQLYPTNNNQNQHYAPFMIQSKRFKQNKQRSQIPAIGTYDLRSCFDRKKSPFQDRVDRFILLAERKKQQMSMFKSSCNRFDKTNKEMPGPASYNLFTATTYKISKQFKKNVIREKKLSDLAKTCPSIPFKDNKFGYAFTDGKLKRIEKDLQQLQLEKQSRKQYVQTLNGQMHFRRESQGLESSKVDFKKKLYISTDKLVKRENVSPSSSQKSFFSAKKPKIQHLYHSKGVPVVQNYKLLGPGQYDIKSKDFDKYSKNERFQFFGSSEVRFKHKPKLQEKGYSLIEMIKENKNLEKAQKKSPVRHSPNRSQGRQNYKKLTYPGPGQYNPNDHHKKIGRGNTFFPQSQRFKQMYPKKLQITDSEKIQSINQIDRKTVRTGSLKKQRFKPMHNVYEPVQSTQIRGILSDNKRSINRITGLTKQTSYETQQINSWSREQKRNNFEKKGYIKQLKEQLQIISQTPYVQEQMRNKIRMMKQMSNRSQKKSK